MGRLPVFSRVLYYVRENYLDKARIRPLQALLGSLDFVQGHTPEVMVEHRYAPVEPWVKIRVNDQTRNFFVAKVDAPWSLRTTLAEIMGFVQDHLLPVDPREEGKRLLAIEIAATNGMLYTLDPHSVLLDSETYGAMRGRGQGAPQGATGMTVSRASDEERVEVRTFTNSPAALAGVANKDRLVSVDGIATSGMNLEDVIAHLQGEVGSKVEVQIARAGWQSPRTMTVTRESFSPASIHSGPRLLRVAAVGERPAGNIGYVHLARFGNDASGELTKALTTLRLEKVGGVILDLRGNSGGLYSEAVKVCDAFFKEGPTVSMVGDRGRRKDEDATDDGAESDLPLAVLVDHASAAASEIVAAALKERDRGVVIGESTFGSGSVQVLFDIPPPEPEAEESHAEPLGLKLTTAQWVSPARRSIQGAGVIPDIELIARHVSDRDGKRLVRFERPSRRKETDYEGRLPAAAATVSPQPTQTIPYLRVPPVVRTDDHGDELVVVGDFEDASGRDFTVEFARDLLAQARSPSRRDLLLRSQALLDGVRAVEDRQITAAMARLGIDWNSGSPSAAGGRLQVDLMLDGKQPVSGGDTVVIRGRAINMGSVGLHRVRAVVHSTAPWFIAGKELAFGTIAAGETKLADVAVRIPVGCPSLADLVSARVVADEPVTVDAPPLPVKVQGGRRPVFAIDYETLEGAKDATGVTTPARSPRRTSGILVKVRNIGASSAVAMTTTLHNVAGQEPVIIDVGRCRTKTLAPAGSMKCLFSYRPRPADRSQTYHFALAIQDSTFSDPIRQRISFEKGGTGAAAGHFTPPTVTASAPLVVTTPTVRLTGVAANAGGVRDVFVTVRDVGRKHLPRKVFYQASPGGQTPLRFEGQFRLFEGGNDIQVTARGPDGLATTTPLVVRQDRP